MVRFATTSNWPMSIALSHKTRCEIEDLGLPLAKFPGILEPRAVQRVQAADRPTLSGVAAGRPQRQSAVLR